ncbi:ABC transporter substrate-binding protein [Actinomadura craniellae]|uniref:ABC transporter substrate-binding protein n=1 Tax=Actinomadura craniellae TaxID=2231787 RepID=A0A365H0G5_9ACTN|nr:ABC transporter substrate-binding protein [Actinomadura craniellae]RAY12508.1 ABC transporter substrate-binding protein [Actinomadura craniellae]
MKQLGGRSTLVRWAAAGAALVAVLAVVLVAFRGEEKPVAPVGMTRAIGASEGTLNLVALPGYVENGSSDPRVDWVTPFEERTKCKVTVRTAPTVEDLVDMMTDPGRRYDGATVPPEAAGRLIDGKHVAPVNPDLVGGYKDLEPRLRSLLRRDDTVYGVPFAWGVNLLVYDPKVVQPAPTSWAAVFDPAQAGRYGRRLIVRDTPLTLGDAALYLKSRNKKLKIDDPFALTPDQLAAAGQVLARQRPHVQSHWQDPADAVSALAGGAAVLGQGWPYHVDVLGRAGRSVAAATPKEGVTGWQDAWMVGARAQHPSCMYQWLKWTSSPDVQQQVAEWTGVAPANPEACARDRLRAEFCNAYHVGDRSYIGKVVFARTPARDCGEDGGSGCAGYAEWTQAWRKAVNPTPS